MVKISKSDLVLPRAEEDAQRAAQAAKPRPRSQHFAVGTYVMMQNKRGLVLRETTNRDNSGIRLLRIRWDDGSMTAVAPFALNR